MSKYHRNTANIRNICILAHVDHGKTTLADALLASNGIISERMSGKMRYLDSRKDEQARGITMKSSAVTLLHKQAPETFVINLIDSPGHVDFSTEVSAATRLSDGAIVIVDVVEGVSAQTHSVLRQAWAENIQTILVLNKMDRLILELQLTPEEAYQHLQRVLEQINAVMATLFTTEAMRAHHHQLEAEARKSAEKADTEADAEAAGDLEGTVFDWAVDTEGDETLYFEPEAGNVIFASAADGWGFTVSDFAKVVAKKLKCKQQVLAKCLWGDFYMTKEKGVAKVKKGALAKGKPSLFVSFVLSQLWAVHKSTVLEPNKDQVAKITSSLNVKLATRVQQTRDYKVILRAIMSQWLPLAPCVMDLVCARLPSPTDISAERVASLFGTDEMMAEEHEKVFNAMLACTFDDEASTPKVSEEAAANALEDATASAVSETLEDPSDHPVIAFISKMVPVDTEMLQEFEQRQQQKQLSDAEAKAKRDAIIARRRKEEEQRRSSRSSISDPDGDAQHDDLVGHAGVALQTNADDGADDGDGDTQQLSTATASASMPAIASSAKDSDVQFVAYARVFSGILRPGQQIHVLGPRYNPSNPSKYRSIATVDRLFLFMGRSFLPLTEAPAGCVVGITGLQGHVLKTATLSTTPTCPTMSALFENAAPIVQVALEAVRIQDVKALQLGMDMLNLADPSVDVIHQRTGEHMLVAAGEVHIERCLTDLREVYAPGVRIKVSPPIIPFRETVVPKPKMDAANEEINATNQRQAKDCYLLDESLETDAQGTVTVRTSGGRWTIQIRCHPIPEPISQVLMKNASTLAQVTAAAKVALHAKRRRVRTQSEKQSEKMAVTSQSQAAEGAASLALSTSTGASLDADHVSLNDLDVEEDEDADELELQVHAALSAKRLEKLQDELETAFSEVAHEFPFSCQQIVTCGPHHKGPNLLINTAEAVSLPGMLQLANALFSHTTKDEPTSSDSAQVTEIIKFFNSLLVGFELITQAGPLCEEPMMGVAFELVSIAIDPEQDVAQAGLSGKLMAAMKAACKQAFLVQEVRLMTAIYRCDLYVESGSLGKVYNVISKRNGKILSEEMQEGSSNFLIVAQLPVTDSFGFAEELRKRTSGLAVPQLIFTHWEVVGLDPFWVPQTEEELLHFGEKGDAPIIARQYMDQTRRRKGLYVQEKIIEHAEKQRTISKKK
eukprot:m.115747 g.115747  ORF g.115747 m.115747 type:complete len:1185 (-) comp13579_c0_seq3:2828-6382(-)